MLKFYRKGIVVTKLGAGFAKMSEVRSNSLDFDKYLPVFMSLSFNDERMFTKNKYYYKKLSVSGIKTVL